MLRLSPPLQHLSAQRVFCPFNHCYRRNQSRAPYLLFWISCLRFIRKMSCLPFSLLKSVWTSRKCFPKNCTSSKGKRERERKTVYTFLYRKTLQICISVACLVSFHIHSFPFTKSWRPRCFCSYNLCSDKPKQSSLFAFRQFLSYGSYTSCFLLPFPLLKSARLLLFSDGFSKTSPSPTTRRKTIYSFIYKTKINICITVAIPVGSSHT